MTTPPERDDVIDRLLRRMQVDAPAPSAGDDCVDAETLARWADGDLSGEERATLIAHTAGCARCQSLLFAMMRTQSAAGSDAPRRQSWTLVRWGLPLAAAAALALWFAIDRDVIPQRASERMEQQSSAASAAKIPPPAAPEIEARRSTAPARGDAAPERDAQVAPPRTRAESRTERRAAAAPSQDTRELKDAPAEAPLASAAPSPATPAPPSASPPAPAQPVVPEPAGAPQASAARVPPPQGPPPSPPEAAKEAPVSPQAATQQIPGGGLAETVAVEARSARNVAQQRLRTQAQWIDVPSPDPLVKWRFSPRGEVERSVDAGFTWSRERIPGARADLLAATAPSSSVCWLAGRDGVVLRFTTGQGWQRVPLPVRAHVVSIEATDAQNATVRAPGARFTTTDGGKTWQ